MVVAHGNCIGGERRPAQGGAVFEIAAPPIRPEGRPRSLGTWPRSGAADVQSAVAAARASASAWSALGAAGRREILARAALELAGNPDPGGLLGTRLALEEGEIAAHFAPLVEVLDQALRSPFESFASRRIAEQGLLLLAPAWGELLASPAAALFSALLLGRTVLFVSDARAPMLADALAAALVRAGLPGGVLSVLHGDGEDVLRAAAASGATTYVLASGFPARARRLERLASTWPGPGAGVGPGFGEGVQSAAAPAFELHVLRSRSALVRSADDPIERATAVVEGAFGRSSSLSGQLPGQVARAICHERSFSRFTEAVLAALRRSPDVAHPAPLVDRESEDHLRRARVLGLDEGATLIFDADSMGSASGPRESGSVPESADGDGDTTPRSPGAGGDAILAPTVFTNVEERMRLALLGRPAPILCLMRVESDERAIALARRLDHDVPAEDLSLDALA